MIPAFSIRCLGCKDWPEDVPVWTPLEWCYPGPKSVLSYWADPRCQTRR